MIRLALETAFTFTTHSGSSAFTNVYFANDTFDAAFVHGSSAQEQASLIRMTGSSTRIARLDKHRPAR